jgi:DNA-directed RNA polymerase specialized sigma24 family protein
MVFSIGVKVLRDREEAEELVQDIFFNIYRKSRLYIHGPTKWSWRKP